MILIKTIAVPPGEDPIHVEMTAEEEAAFLAEQAASASAQAMDDLKTNALQKLGKTDDVYIRCAKAGVAFPQEWVDYVTELRAVVRGSRETMPVQPEYPAGT